MEKNLIKAFYDEMEAKKYPIDAIFAFVYNDYETYDNDPHLEECFDEQEVHEILDSVSDLFDITLSFSSEKKFILWCSQQQTFTKNVYVYTMAQYISGFSRRTLIPAICQYYGFINLNADAYMSAIGCNKKTMYHLLTNNNLSQFLAPTFFCDTIDEINYKQIYQQLGEHIILKPINESCCIDTFILRNYTKEELLDSANIIIDKYGYLMVQKYIRGKEIGITTFCHKQEIHTLEPVQIVFSEGKTHLTHEDSFYNNYKLQTCNVPNDLLEACKKMSQTLSFYCTTRYDFRFDGKNYYLFDLSPNPTVNGYTSSNIAARTTLNSDHRGILRLMAFEKISLFEPSLDRTHNV